MPKQQQRTSPTKEQAIVLDSIEGISIDDYIDGLEKLIDTNFGWYK